MDETEALASGDLNLDDKGEQSLADTLTEIACRQLQTSNSFKKPLIEKWKNYEDLKAGNIKKKLRVQFNVALPVFSGMLDTLAADFDEPVELEFKRKHPSDYFKVQRIQSAWNLEKKALGRDARWDYKARVDRNINILYGRSILKEYAESDPKYRNVLAITHPTYFHNQPIGGGILENHLFAGEEGVLRSEDELKGGGYNKAQVEKLIRDASTDDYQQEVTDYHREKLARFQSVGLDADKDSYTGERTFNLCEWVLTYKGKRYYLLFDPWTMTWVRFDKLATLFSQDLFPWVSWASFEDDKLFWTQSYADIIYPVADSIVTLYNQELTNREKKNLGAKFYDKDLIIDVAKLDEAQYRPDALVPVDTKGGSRKLSDAVYTIDTPELQGTIELLNWTNQSLQKETGITDISQGVAQNAAKKVNVAYMEQANVAKRLGYKSQSYTEAWGEIGMRFYQGLKDHMSKDMYIEILGDQGIEPDVLTRSDLDLEGDLGVEVISSTARKAETQKKKEARIKGISLLMQDQNINSEWRTAAILREIGEFSEEEIKLALDTRNYASRESVAKAHIAIEELLAGLEPEINFAADAVFLKIIYDYMMEHRNKLGKAKGMQFAKYIAAHMQSAMENGQRAGTQRGIISARRQQASGKVQPAAAAPAAPARPAMPAAPQPEMAQGGMHV